MPKLLLLAALAISACSTAPQGLRQINRDINSYRYIADKAGNDHWAQPAEFYSRGGGDCEDFAIAKYYAVKAQNNHADLNILLVRDVKKELYHAVLLVNNTWVLDNQISYVYRFDSQVFKINYDLIGFTKGTRKWD